MFLLIAACMIASASACCIPEQWESYVGMALGNFNKTTKKTEYIEGNFKMSFDAKNKMIAEDQTIVINDVVTKQYMVMDYNQNVAFIIRNGTCEKYQLDHFPERCFPEDNSLPAKYGVGQNQLDARGYSLVTNETKIYMTVTADTCVPIAIDTVTDLPGSYHVQFFGYNNITAGIADTQVFNVPTVCALSGPVQPVIPGMSLGRRSAALHF